MPNERIRLNLNELDKRYLADIVNCTQMLHDAAGLVSSAQLQPQQLLHLSQSGACYDRIIIGDPHTLALPRLYMVGFCGVRKARPEESAITMRLEEVDKLLTDDLHPFRVGLYHTRLIGDNYANLAVLPDKESGSKWRSQNGLHIAAVGFARDCYSSINKFTGDLKGGLTITCEIEIDEAFTYNF